MERKVTVPVLPGQQEDVFHSNEVIVKLFINKLITLTVRTKHILGLSQQMSDYCCDYVEGFIKTSIAMHNMAIDEEDNAETPIRESSKAWIEIKQPLIPSVDAYASTLIRPGSPRDKLAGPEPEITEDSKAESRYRIDSMYERTSYIYTESSPAAKGKKKEKIERNIEPSFEIKDLKPVVDSPEVIELRLKKQIEIQRIVEEKKKEKEAEEQAKVAQATKTVIKPFDGSKFTFDSNGVILPKKTPRPEFLSKEFRWTSFDIKSVEAKKEQTRKKLAKKETEVIYNTADPFNSNPVKAPDKKEQPRIMPSGSNFDIILPEIGVRVTEDRKIKGGAKEFSSKFKKTSNEDYEKMLNESIPQLNASLIKSKLANTMFSGSYGSANFDSSAFIPYTEGNLSLGKTSFLNQSNQNPLLGTQEDKGANTNALSFKNANNLTKSLDMTQHLSTSRMRKTEDKLIKLNKKMNMSVKIAMDAMNDLDISSHTSRLNTNERNLFKSLALKPLMTTPQGNDESIKYSKSIVKSKDWGRTHLENPLVQSLGNQTFVKPSKLSLIRELGINILNTKAPRSRKFNHDNNGK